MAAHIWLVRECFSAEQFEEDLIMCEADGWTYVRHDIISTPDHPFKSICVFQKDPPP
jgi:hypothetical protein